MAFPAGALAAQAGVVRIAYGRCMVGDRGILGGVGNRIVFSGPIGGGVQERLTGRRLR
jgi:hypothetical protein